MNALKLGLIGLILAAVLAAPFLAQQRAAARWRASQTATQEQAAVLDQLSAENQRLSNLAAQVVLPRALSPAESSDLLKLRNEVGQLRRTLKEIEQLERNLQRLRARLDETTKEEAGRENDTALLADELPRRQARLARLKRWLEETPEEKIPELQFLPQDNWIKRVDDPLVTDEDYRNAMSCLRADADARFGRMTFSALKQYGQANNGQFPTDLSQLEPYFASPVDPATLQRYAIVPAQSLVSSLAAVGGDWVITEKVPVNKDLDQRLAIGMTGGRQVIQAGRWDPVP